MRQFLGKALWATRPGNSAMPFLAGAYAWSVWGPPMSKYTPPAILRGMMAPPPPPPVHNDTGRTVYVDAAQSSGGYVAGMIHTTGDCRVWRAPPWIRKQQAAELFGLERVLKVAAYTRSQHTKVVGDNLASLIQVVQGTIVIMGGGASASGAGACTAPPHPHPRDRTVPMGRGYACGKLEKMSWPGSGRPHSRDAPALRRIAHCLRWSGLQAQVSWVASEFNPADPVSRALNYPSPLDVLSYSHDIVSKLWSTPEAEPRPIGTVRSRGWGGGGLCRRRRHSHWHLPP